MTEQQRRFCCPSIRSELDSSFSWQTRQHLGSPGKRALAPSQSYTCIPWAVAGAEAFCQFKLNLFFGLR
jgi:hypothetical protein